MWTKSIVLANGTRCKGGDMANQTHKMQRGDRTNPTNQMQRDDRDNSLSWDRDVNRMIRQILFWLT